MESIALVVVAACVCAALVYAFYAKVAKTQKETPPAAGAAGTPDPAPARTAWQALGEDAVTREESIQRLFDARSGTVEFETQWDFDYVHAHASGATEVAYSSMSFLIARPLAQMDNLECEVLRAAYLLYNAGLVDGQAWRDLSFCSVYGAGAAAIVSCEYREPVKLPFSDDAGAIRYYADAQQATIGSAQAKLLAMLDAIAQRPGAPAFVAQSIGRLRDATG